MRQVVGLLLCIFAAPGLAAEPASLTFQHVVIDEKPPQRPWIKIVGDRNGDNRRRIVLAKIAVRDFAVAYLPNNDAIEVNLSAFSTPVATRWFDPSRGRTTPATGLVPNRGTHRFQPPAKGDWVLMIGQH